MGGAWRVSFRGVELSVLSVQHFDTSEWGGNARGTVYFGPAKNKGERQIEITIFRYSARVGASRLLAFARRGDKKPVPEFLHALFFLGGWYRSPLRYQ
jgi:hypothetical protein